MESTGVELTGIESTGVKLTGPEALNPAKLYSKLSPDWLILEGRKHPYDHAQWVETVEKIATVSDSSNKLILIAEPDPQQFLAAFWAALRSHWNVALANPRWGAQEWQSVGQMICPTLAWGTAIPDGLLQRRAAPSPQISNSPKTSADSTSSRSQILIPTGGSSGRIKFVPHTWQTLMASVNGFCQYFSPSTPINSYCVLPLYHVSGLMQVLRSVVSGGQIAIAPFSHIESTPHTKALPQPFPFSRKPSLQVLSLVPTQLHRLLQSNKLSWLKQFDVVFLGGAPAWPTLLEAAQAHKIPLSLSYGMTETAAMVTALKPDAFLKGDRTSGMALPHAKLTILKDNTSLSPNQTGQIAIQATSIPAHLSPDQTLLTDDLGYLDIDGHLHITGRASQFIISGGENISSTEVEAAIRTTGQVKDVCVFGLPDAHWGEVVTAVYVPQTEAVTNRSLQQALSTSAAHHSTPTLSRYKHPKHWLALAALPRNAQGKLNRQSLIQQAQAQLKQLSS